MLKISAKQIWKSSIGQLIICKYMIITSVNTSTLHNKRMWRIQDCDYIESMDSYVINVSFLLDSHINSDQFLVEKEAIRFQERFWIKSFLTKTPEWTNTMMWYKSNEVNSIVLRHIRLLRHKRIVSLRQEYVNLFRPVLSPTNINKVTLRFSIDIASTFVRVVNEGYLF